MKISTTPSRVSVAALVRRRFGAGFTLVELLVVLGIIVILLALLLPTLGGARERANAIKCQAQERQILQAIVLHSANHSGYMPMSGMPYVSIDPVTGVAQPAFDPVSLQDPRRVKYSYYQTSDGGYHLMSMLGAIAPLLGQTVRDDSLAHVEEDLQRGLIHDLFICPSDIEGGRLGNTVFEGGQTKMSFAFSDPVFGWGSASLGAPGRLRGKLSRIPRPSETFLFADAKPRTNDYNWMLFCEGEADVTLRDVMATTVGPPNNPHASQTPPPRSAWTWDMIDYTRHRGFMDVAFADGHVEHVPITEGALSKISMNRDFPSD